MTLTSKEGTTQDGAETDATDGSQGTIDYDAMGAINLSQSAAWHFSELFTTKTEKALDYVHKGHELYEVYHPREEKQNKPSSETPIKYQVDKMFLKKGNVIYHRDDGRKTKINADGSQSSTNAPANDTFPKNKIIPYYSFPRN